MKLTRFVSLLVMGLVLSLMVVGCRKRPTDLTVLPGSRTGQIGDPDSGKPIDANQPPVVGTTDGLIATSPGHPGWSKNTDHFASQTVHFDFDSTVLKGSEKDKAAAVADYLKGNPGSAVEIEGHCDERGTEEYNRSLGERRALAVREELVRLGMDPNRVDTISYGEDRPASTGHDDDAWRQNRRGVFILLTPPSAMTPPETTPTSVPATGAM